MSSSLTLQLKVGCFAIVSSRRVLSLLRPQRRAGPGLPPPRELRSCAVICWGDWVKTSADPLEEQKAKIALSKLKLSTTE